MNQEQPTADPVMQQVSLLNLRLNDMYTQLNAVLKTLIDSNDLLQKENVELKSKL
ncbi:MAG: hypothetical protein ACQCN3_14015 [Candidatus Bathyarchaeia archaeon]|jgi:regulator of replication initiation timing